MPVYKADPGYEPGTLKPRHGTDWALPRFHVPALPTEAYRQAWCSCAPDGNCAVCGYPDEECE